MIETLISNSLKIIEVALSTANTPVICCSFGKDSMVLLDLVRKFDPNIPVLYFRGFEHSKKHLFADDVIKLQGLNLHLIRPSFRDVVAKGNQIEIIEAYQVNEGALLYFPLEAEQNYQPDKDTFCAIDKINEKTDPAPGNFDCIFIGHRNDDSDPIHGDIPLSDYTFDGNGVKYVYPLKDWTESDIWEASKSLGIQQNEQRYNGDMAFNNDYYPLCTKCLNKNEPLQVDCPKIGVKVNNLGKVLNLEERTAEWRQSFVNIRSKQ